MVNYLVFQIEIEMRFALKWYLLYQDKFWILFFFLYTDLLHSYSSWFSGFLRRWGVKDGNRSLVFVSFFPSYFPGLYTWLIAIYLLDSLK